MKKFLFNSGLYEATFFTKHKIDFSEELGNGNTYISFDDFIYPHEIGYHEWDLNENLTDEEKEEKSTIGFRTNTEKAKCK